MQDKIDQIKSLASQMMQEKPLNREDIKTMLASLDQDTLTKYTGKNSKPTDEELGFIYKFLGI